MTTPTPGVGVMTPQALATMQKYGIVGGLSNGPMMSFSQQLTDSSKVYVGDAGRPKGLAGPYGPTEPFSMSYAQAKLAPRDWDGNKLKEFVNKGIMYKVPGFSPDVGLPEVMDLWDFLLQKSFELNKGLKPDQKKWTPMDVLETYNKKPGSMGTKKEGDWIIDLATGERIKYVGPTSRKVTSKRIDLSSPEDVQALATQVLREALGRAPNAKELAQFRSTIAGYEKSNPEVTTTVQQLSPDLATGEVRVTDESSTTSGGVTDAARAALIQEPTQKTQEYGKYQSATTYWNALMSMISGG